MRNKVALVGPIWPKCSAARNEIDVIDKVKGGGGGGMGTPKGEVSLLKYVCLPSEKWSTLQGKNPSLFWADPSLEGDW